MFNRLEAVAQVTAQSRIGPPPADWEPLGNIEVVIGLRWHLVLDVFNPYLVRHVAARGNPIASRPQMLAPVALAPIARSRSAAYANYALSGAARRARPDRLGGVDTRMCTWSPLIDPACTIISWARAVSRSKSRGAVAHITAKHGIAVLHHPDQVILAVPSGQSTPETTPSQPP
jgi:hypothetical protein